MNRNIQDWLDQGDGASKDPHWLDQGDEASKNLQHDIKILWLHQLLTESHNESQSPSSIIQKAKWTIVKRRWQRGFLIAASFFILLSLIWQPIKPSEAIKFTGQLGHFVEGSQKIVSSEFTTGKWFCCLEDSQILWQDNHISLKMETVFMWQNGQLHLREGEGVFTTSQSLKVFTKTAEFQLYQGTAEIKQEKNMKNTVSMLLMISLISGHGWLKSQEQELKIQPGDTTQLVLNEKSPEKSISQGRYQIVLEGVIFREKNHNANVAFVAIKRGDTKFVKKVMRNGDTLKLGKSIWKLTHISSKKIVLHSGDRSLVIHSNKNLMQVSFRKTHQPLDISRIIITIKNSSASSKKARLKLKVPKNLTVLSSNVKITDGIVEQKLSPRSEKDIELEVRATGIGLEEGEITLEIFEKDIVLYESFKFKTYIGERPEVFCMLYDTDDPCEIGEKLSYILKIRNDSAITLDNLQIKFTNPSVKVLAISENHKKISLRKFFTMAPKQELTLRIQCIATKKGKSVAKFVLDSDQYQNELREITSFY